MTLLGGTHTRKSSVLKHSEDQLNGDDFAQNFEICLPTDMIGAILSILDTSDTFRGHLIPEEVHYLSTMKIS